MSDISEDDFVYLWPSLCLWFLINVPSNPKQLSGLLQEIKWDSFYRGQGWDWDRTRFYDGTGKENEEVIKEHNNYQINTYFAQ